MEAEQRGYLVSRIYMFYKGVPVVKGGRLSSPSQQRLVQDLNVAKG